MWIWKRYIAASDEPQWAERLKGQSGVVFSASPAARRVCVQCYCENAAAALVLRAAYGGRAAVQEDKDPVTATAPRSTPPLFIRDKLVLCTDFEQLIPLQQRYPGRNVLCCPAERAFGTGHHATTASCLRLLCDEARRRQGTQWRMLDVGCGTGVLALAALKLGARSALGLDHDSVAVEIAQRNRKRNGASADLRFFRADIFEWEPTEQDKAQVIAANLFSGVLQRAFPRLIAALVCNEPGVVIVSGILRTQAQETLEYALRYGLCLTSRVTRGKWVTFRLTYRP